MNKVTTVNLNGRAFQVEEQAYEALRAYLDEASRLLADDPDCKEIMADLEQAIADKGSRYLGAGKNVLGDGAMKRILAEMGPVEPGAEAGTATGTGAPAVDTRAGAPPPPRETSGPKRLYLIKEGAMLAGVCNGMAAYFGMDPTIMRLIFVVLLFLSSGFWIIVYLVLMFVVPAAKTPEERAAARGLPFNAQELVEQAKRHYSDIKDGHQRWRAKRQRDREKEFWSSRHHQGYEPPRPFDQPQPGYGAQVAAGVVLPLVGIVSAVLTVVFIIALASLLTTGELLGWRLPLDIPPWAAILALVAAYAIIGLPLRAIRHASYQAVGQSRGWFVLWDGLLWLALVVLLSWLAFRYMPGVREFIDELPYHLTVVTTELGRLVS